MKKDEKEVVKDSGWVECDKCGVIKNRDKCVPCGCDK